jgi:hypothetical protein
MLATIWFSLLSSRLLSRNVKVKIYRTIILPVVLYGCESWSLTVREETRLRTGFYGEYLDLREMRWAGHVARMGENMKMCRVLVGRPKGKRPL